MSQEFKIADWWVDPGGNRISRGEESHRLEPRVMDLLVYLAERAGEVLSRNQIFRDVWHDVDVGESALLTAVSTLRRALRDDPKQPRFIETIPKRGYRLIADTNARSAALAVLPLRDLSLDADQSYLADGISELLLNDLGSNPGLHVISWPSVSRIRERQLSVRQIAEELGARYVVDGSVLHSGNNVRVAIRLSDTGEGSQVWSDTFDVELREILNLQRTLAGRIAGAITGRLVRGAPPPAATSERSNAMVAYLRGRFHWYKMSTEHLDLAQDYFEESIALDPSFGPAHAGLADVWGSRGYWGLLPMSQVRDKIWAPLRKAKAISEQWSELQIVLGSAHFVLERDWDAAEKHLRQAIRLNPNQAHAHFVFGLFTITIKREDAADWIDKAARLDPLNPAIQLARALLAMSRNHDESALQYIERVLELDDAHPPGNRVRANLAWYLKDPNAAQYEARLWTKDEEITALLAAEKSQAFDRSVLLRIGRILRSRSVEQYIQPMLIARAFSLGGDPTTAIEILEDACKADDLMPIVLLQSDCAWHPLRSIPRFHKLLADIGLPA